MCKSKYKKNYAIVFIIVFIIINSISWIYCFFFDKTIVSSYFIDTAFFSDFFSPMLKLRTNTYIEPHFSTYPALANIFAIFLRNFTGELSYERLINNPALIAVMIALFIISSICIYDMMISILGRKWYMIIISMIYFISGPSLFLYTRGNYLIFIIPMVFYFIMHYEDGNVYKRNFSYALLAIAIAFKIYPICLSILLIKKKNLKNILSLILYCIIFCILPFLFFGPTSLIDFISNLFTSEGTIIMNHATNFNAFFIILKIKLLGLNNMSIGWYKLLPFLAGIFLSIFSKEKYLKFYFLICSTFFSFSGSYLYNICFMYIPFVYLLKSDINDKFHILLKYVYIFFYAVIFSVTFFPLDQELTKILSENNMGYISYNIELTNFLIFILFVLYVADFIYTLVKNITERKIINE